MERNMNIAMMGHKWFPSRAGGIEVVVGELAARMAEKGNHVTCYNRKGMDCPNEYKGVRVKTVPTIEMRGAAAFSSSFFAALRCAFGKYDVVHIHAEGPALWTWIPHMMGKKCVVTIHGLDHERAKWGGFARNIILRGEKNAVRYADEIIVLNKSNQKYFMDKYGRKTILIPNGIDRPQYISDAIIKEKYGLEKDGYILFLSRLVPEKRPDLLIQAYLELHTDKKLVIAGVSSDTDKYAQSLHEMADGNENIIFTGFVSGEMLQSLYANTYCYVLPSDLEGMPISLLEAMSYGRCVLTSNIPECTDVVNGYGYSFEHSIETDLRDKLQYLIDNPNIVKAVSEQASEYICGTFNWDCITDRTLNLYADLCGEHRDHKEQGKQRELSHENING